MILRLFPKKVDFFGLFEKQASYAVEAARVFKEIIADGKITDDEVKRMHAIEQKADEAAHHIIEQLNKTFITPFDREDIHSLAVELDDVIDMIYTITSRLKVYRLSGIYPNLIKFSQVIEESVIAISHAIKAMHNIKNLKAVSDACVEINRLENVGDAMRDEMLTELFDNEKDHIAVIKWKEIYQEAETILDICEDVAHMVQSIMLKQA